jgi:hypothetical protein
MSQSLFLVQVKVIDDTGSSTSFNSISKVGYSCIAIFFAIIFGSVAVIGAILNGFRRYTGGIPLVGSCSAAISAACHPPKGDSAASLNTLQWGCVKDDKVTAIGHCSLSSLEVTPPTEGYFYAGK